jgi:DNA-binding NarL/FixJ family response regulator
MKRITVLLAEDHAIVREGLRSLLQLERDFEVVGEAATGRQAVELARKHRPTVVVMDIAMPLLNGFEATRQILLAVPDTKVLVLSAHSDDEYVAHMATVGASGYLVKQNSGQMLVHAIRQIVDGHPYFSPSIAKRLEDAERRSRESGAPRGKPKRPLTAREAEVLQLVAEGAANKQVAAELGISTKTVEKHRQQLMDKLDIHDTAGLTRHAIATGVIESSIQVTTHGSGPKG